MPRGRSSRKVKAADLHLDPRDIQAEIRANRASNEKFLREYSAWFERNAQRRSRKRRTA